MEWKRHRALFKNHCGCLFVRSDNH
ncbi:MAG: DUF3763 domain-containing protein [Spirochaetaceae bacterium]|nr:DUF3763 domain-containing protein [Spirochaetaceae bacterium]